MAEFCLECMNKYIIGENDILTESDVTTSMDLCEGCGEWKECVISINRRPSARFLQSIISAWKKIFKK